MPKNKDLIDFGNRLRSARKMAGLSMKDLSTKAGDIITKQAISKYENGMMKPSSDILIQLAVVLGVKPEFFFRHTTIELSSMQFRKRANLPVKIIESLKQRTIDFLERYIELESILGIHEKFSNPLSNFVINSLQDVENAALKLRDAWELGLAPLSNLLELLEENGIRVYEVQNIDDFDGLSARVGDFHVIVINNALSTDRIRFTAAHELAHILCEFPKDYQKEKLCHAFAGAFLLPKTILERELMKKREQISLWELEEIKQLYGISIQAIVKRAHMLGIVSDFYYRNFQVMLNRKGWKKKEPVEYKGREDAIRFKQLLHYGVSEEIITLSRGAELANMNLSKFMENVRAAV
jgi:Zn-dependent peptidase ImmA (M78 family)/DNA-binding XRE family transcriptional regulator